MRYRITLFLATTILMATGCAEGPTATQPVRPSAMMFVDDGSMTPESETTESSSSTTIYTSTPVSSAGCTRGQGYWKQLQHAWPAGHDRSMSFFGSSTTWQAILEMEPAELRQASLYVQVGYQWIAARLNASANGGAPQHVASAIDAATAYFMGSPAPEFDAERTKDLLDRFNNGREGVRACR